MLRVIGCVAEQHDPRLVALAALICVLASYTAIGLLHQARAMQGARRGLWLSVAALASGSGIWATHFIAMLAYASGLPSGYDLSLTTLSLVAAVLLTGAGLRLSLWERVAGSSWLGGAVIGGGIAAMHYTGMAAYQVGGTLRWDASLVAASLAIGAAAGAAALAVGLRRRTFPQQAFAALLLTLAICGHHFTAMGAVTIEPDPTVVVSAAAAPHQWLAGIVAVASLTILILALAALVLDGRERRRREQAELVSSLANAAVEGIVVCDGDRIVTVNDSLAALLDRSPASLVGMPVGDVLPALTEAGVAPSGHSQPREAELVSAAGDAIPVELIEHAIEVGGRPHRAVAVRDLRARREAERHIHFLAHHDGLTGLANRASFNARLDHAIAEALATGRPAAVLCLDLDRFKQVNDLYGHAAGDAMLQRFAACVAGALEGAQSMARLGGDEFAVIAPGIDDAAAAERLARTVLETLAREEAASPAAPALSTSIGIALCPLDAADRETLMSHADTAMYRAKLEGRGGYRRFEPQMDRESRAKRRLEQDMREAVARGGELDLVYQPQTTIGTGRVAGFEALLRWRHPTRGDLSPATFIPIAEETGAILQIGDWALQQACREAAAWTAPLRVAVNVSAVQLHSAAFPHRVHEILIESGLSPSRLELEITETALIRDLDRALSALRRLKALGVRIAMDDFGTGYSSLSNLRAFPFDKIKIDRSFVRAVDTSEQGAAIVRAVLGLGNGLGLPVLAEGVETAAELAFLERERCQEAQGYLIGRPAPIEAFEEIVRPRIAGERPKIRALRPQRREQSDAA